MKRAVKILLIVLLVGCGLAVAGKAAGGELYSAYYGGGLHTLRETIRDTGGWFLGWRNGLHHAEWWDDDGAYHSGWFFGQNGWRSRRSLADRLVDDTLDKIADGVEDVVDKVFDDAGGEIEDALDGAFDDALNGMPDISDTLEHIPVRSDSEPVNKLQLLLNGGSFHIMEGESFSVSGCTPGQNVMQYGMWTLEADADGQPEPATITLPAQDRIFDEITILMSGAEAYLHCPLAGREFDINLKNGSYLDTSRGAVVCYDELYCDISSDGEAYLDLAATAGTGEWDRADPLDGRADEIDCYVSDGSVLHLTLADRQEEWDIEARATDADEIMIDGQGVVGGAFGHHAHAGNRHAEREMYLSANVGVIDVSFSG